MNINKKDTKVLTDIVQSRYWRNMTDQIRHDGDSVKEAVDVVVDNTTDTANIYENTSEDQPEEHNVVEFAEIGASNAKPDTDGNDNSTEHKDKQ